MQARMETTLQKMEMPKQTRYNNINGDKRNDIDHAGVLIEETLLNMTEIYGSSSAQLCLPFPPRLWDNSLHCRGECIGQIRGLCKQWSCELH